MIILFCGPSGSGKTTLCKYLDRELHVPFLETSSKTLWHKHGITDHRQIILKSNQNPRWGIDFQKELLDYREKMYDDFDHFCSDRSPLDNAAYFLLQNSPWATQKETGDYLERCYKLASKATKIVVLNSWDTNYVPDDGMRITNQYYQDVYTKIMQMVIHWYDKPNMWELNSKSLPIRKESLALFIESLRRVKEKRSLL